MLNDAANLGRVIATLFFLFSATTFADYNNWVESNPRTYCEDHLPSSSSSYRYYCEYVGSQNNGDYSHCYKEFQETVSSGVIRGLGISACAAFRSECHYNQVTDQCETRKTDDDECGWPHSYYDYESGFCKETKNSCNPAHTEFDKQTCDEAGKSVACEENYTVKYNGENYYCASNAGPNPDADDPYNGPCDREGPTPYYIGEFNGGAVCADHPNAASEKPVPDESESSTPDHTQDGTPSSSATTTSMNADDIGQSVDKYLSDELTSINDQTRAQGEKVANAVGKGSDKVVTAVSNSADKLSSSIDKLTEDHNLSTSFSDAELDAAFLNSEPEVVDEDSKIFSSSQFDFDNNFLQLLTFSSSCSDFSFSLKDSYTSTIRCSDTNIIRQIVEIFLFIMILIAVRDEFFQSAGVQ